jgi:phage terminase large subunit
MTLQMTTPLDRFLHAAKAAGCPPDQLRNFRAVGYAPQPKQLAFHAAARACDSPGRPVEVGIGGARGPGKSHAVLAQLGADDCQRVPGLKCLLLRKVGSSAKEGFEDLLTRAFPPWLRYYVPSRSILKFPNGSRILIGHFQNERDIDKYLGLEYDTIAVEETTGLSLKKYQAITLCNRTSKSGWRPRIYNSTNPGGIGHAWYKSRFIVPWKKRQETDTRFIFATVDDNVHVNPGYRAMLDRLIGWEKRAYRYGDWDIAAGQFFTNWSYDLHVCKPIKILPSWPVWCSLDYGFVHPTSVHLITQDGDGMIYFVDEHYQSRWLPEQHADGIKAMLGRNDVRLDRLFAFVAGADVFAQRGSIKTIADQYFDCGIKLSPAQMDRITGAAEWLKRLGSVEAKIAPTVQISERCTRLIECLPMLEHDPNRPEDVLKVDIDEAGNGGDDPYDDGRYGLMAARRSSKPVAREKKVNMWRELE